MAAATAARCLGATREHIRQGLSQFQGLPHRLELVGESGGVRFFNDSFSTTPVSTVAALESFRGSLALIAGGYDKKLDIEELARAVAERAEVLVTMGETGPMLAQQVRAASAAAGRNVVIREAESLEEAVAEAESHSMPGTSVLLSPAFASYDMFENCIQRGEQFKSIVREKFLQARSRSRGA
jgi:UDP-N-acetylmuramoylalanine--D-glutamate ligase